MKFFAYVFGNPIIFKGSIAPWSDNWSLGSSSH